MTAGTLVDIGDEAAIGRQLEAAAEDAGRVREILSKARGLEGLDSADAAALIEVSEPELVAEIHAAAREVKDTIYGPRLVIFAPLYVSNQCGNECTYCAFRATNREVSRRTLTQEEIAAEVRVLVEQGHKRVLLVSGEAFPREGFSYILKAIDTIYRTRSGNGEIRRVNVNVAPLSVEQFRELKGAGIGTYQLFQETYHRETYSSVHTAGRKADFDWRISAMHRAMEAGIDDVGIGVLFGLHEWRFEVLAMLRHIASLEREFGVGPHTISVPRLEPAAGTPFASRPPFAVSDADFLKMIAILRLAVPYTGILMSTRETPEIRRKSFQLGVSQISAGSRTDPGGYAGDGAFGQFQLGDQRPLDEVVRDVTEQGFVPSFCTACYRLGRTGQDFMDLAKPGEIRNHCDPNALSTLVEYLQDYASAQTRAAGEQMVARQLKEQGPLASALVKKVRAGERDVFV